jgi:hypothetical protein
LRQVSNLPNSCRLRSSWLDGKSRCARRTARNFLPSGVQSLKRNSGTVAIRREGCKPEAFIVDVQYPERVRCTAVGSPAVYFAAIYIRPSTTGCLTRFVCRTHESSLDFFIRGQSAQVHNSNPLNTLQAPSSVCSLRGQTAFYAHLQWSPIQARAPMYLLYSHKLWATPSPTLSSTCAKVQCFPYKFLTTLACPLFRGKRHPL